MRPRRLSQSDAGNRHKLTKEALFYLMDFFPSKLLLLELLSVKFLLLLMISISYIVKCLELEFLTISSMFSLVLSLNLYFYSTVTSMSLNLLRFHWLCYLGKVAWFFWVSLLLSMKWRWCYFVDILWGLNDCTLCQLVKWLAHSKVQVNLSIDCLSWYMIIYESNFSLRYKC